MTDKRSPSGGHRAPPKTPNTMPLNPLAQEFQTLDTSLGLLRRLQGIDRSKGHPEQRRGEGRRDRLYQHGPSQGRQQGEYTGVGSGISEPRDRGLQPASTSFDQRTAQSNVFYRRPTYKAAQSPA
jgi:hypothetical protein